MHRLNEKRKVFIQKWAKKVLLSVWVGFFAGTAATIFLVLLDIATQTRESHPKLIWGLPLAGFCVGYIYYLFGKDIAGGNNLILEEIHNPRHTIPIRTAPFVLFGTVITHLFGGSAGREGTAVQMGASLADQVSKLFKVEMRERKSLLVAGTGAGFGAAIGAPWAGVIFGMEVIQIGRPQFFAWGECLIASFVAYYTTLLFKAPHTHYPLLTPLKLDVKTLIIVSISGIIFGVTARFFSVLTHQIEKMGRRFISYPPLKPFFGGIVLVILFSWEGSYRYVGLGISTIQDALSFPTPLKDPILKIIFTAITIGSGFKGGEFIPLVFIGTTLGNVLSQWFSASPGLLATLGFASVFAAASNTPIACIIMACEIFGFSVLPYVTISCFLAYYVSGHKSIYVSQPISDRKLGNLKKLFSRHR